NLKSYTLPKDLYENLLIHGVKLELHFNENDDRDTLLLIPDRNISLDEWKSIWNTVAEAFPSIPQGHSAQTQLMNHSMFREKQEKLKRGEDVYLGGDIHFENGKIVEKKEV
ncbi:MAG: hypothetical protein PHV42_03795, partial [Candidatus Pacebacteria bacterium]|nr:hypothetical protein [Candidatus Paceibacterota bacterium]